MIRKGSSLALAIVLASATPATAQKPVVELTPYAGVFIPVGNLLEAGFLFPVTGGHVAGLALGGRATAWLAGPIGIEGTLNYAFSDVEEGIVDVFGSGDAYVWAGSARLALRIGSLSAPVSLVLSAGLGYVSRGGDAYEDVEDEGDLAYAGGLGLRIDLPGRLAIRLDVDDYLYNYDATQQTDIGEISIDSQFQADFVIAVGLSIQLSE